MPIEKPFRHLPSEDQAALRKIGKNLDHLGYFPASAFRIISRNRHFQMFVPRERGGLETDLVTAAEIIEEYAYIEGNLGWIVQIGAGGGVFSAYLDEKTGRAFFAKPDQVIAGSDFAGGTARATKGGYKLSGHWKYASGSMHASAFTGNVRISDGPQAGKIMAFILPADRVEVIPSWNAMGMRATDSHEYKVEDVFVPENQMFSMTPEDLKIDSAPIFRIPFLNFARAVFVPVLSGSALRYLDLYRDILQRKKLRTDSDAFRALEKMEKLLQDHRRSFFKKTRSMWEDAEKGTIPPGKSARFSEFCVEMTYSCLKMVESCHRHTGMEGIRMDTPINIAYRNIVTAGAHYLLGADSL